MQTEGEDAADAASVRMQVYPHSGAHFPENATIESEDAEGEYRRYASYSTGLVGTGPLIRMLSTHAKFQEAFQACSSLERQCGAGSCLASQAQTADYPLVALKAIMLSVMIRTLRSHVTDLSLPKFRLSRLQALYSQDPITKIRLSEALKRAMLEGQAAQEWAAQAIHILPSELQLNLTQMVQ